MKTEKDVKNKKRFDLGTLRDMGTMGAMGDWLGFEHYFWRDRRN